MSDRFSEIYEKNEWGFGSGAGSLPLNNIDYIKFIKTLLSSNNIKSVVDFGCGDWQFSRFINWDGVTYTGFDIVESVVVRNQALFGRDNITFHVFNQETHLPHADLFLCKDVFQHLPNRLIQQYLRLFKEHARFMLITNDDWPAEDLINLDIENGGWRPVRLEREPFSEVAPVILTWMTEWGGWKPTRKATCLIVGDQR